MSTRQENIKNQLHYLGLDELKTNWETILKNARYKKSSYTSFLKNIVEKEYYNKKNKVRAARLKRAKIPELLTIETFPFNKQPKLNRKLVMEAYDSLDYVVKKEDLIFIGPTGCGKTGLATSFLIHAINNEKRGLFISFKEMMHKLYQAQAIHNEMKVIKYFSAFDVLLIDEVGYENLERKEAGLFFEVIKRRHKKKTTIVTTQLGFNEWNNFISDTHLTAAILDRLTVRCTVFNMKECISIRPKKITNATVK